MTAAGGLMPVAAAQAAVLALARPTGVEEVALREAAGRWLAAPVAARRDQPPFAASAMDGYAVSGEATPGARFAVVGEAGAGHPFAGTIGPGQAVRIFTGAPVPAGTTRVVIQEDVRREADLITVGPTPDAGLNIRAAGQDFRAGDTLSPRRLRPMDLALLAAMNCPAVPVARRPEVAILPTGDELVQPGEAPRPDQIVASTGPALAAMVAAAGGRPRLLPIARDSVGSLGSVLDLAEDADIVVTIGGASVGDHDLVARVLAERGMVPAFHRIAMRPGKPLMAGRLGAAALIGLPGNPVSSMVCTILFLLPLIRAMQGDPAPLPVPSRAVLAEAVEATGPRSHYMRARLSPGDGLPRIAALARQDSSLLSVLVQADALLIRPAGDGPRAAGELADFLPLDGSA